MSKTCTPDELAKQFNVDAKAIRRHLRAIIAEENAKIVQFNETAKPEDHRDLIETPGRGGSWAIGSKTQAQVKERLESSARGGRRVELD